MRRQTTVSLVPLASREGVARRHETRSKRGAELIAALARLRPDARAALLLSSEGFTGAEIAAAIGRTELATRALASSTQAATISIACSTCASGGSDGAIRMFRLRGSLPRSRRPSGRGRAAPWCSRWPARRR